MKIIGKNTENLHGEQIFCDLLKNEPYFSDWTLMWGLDIKNHPEKIEGQNDFLLIGPPGIVVIEVKGGTIHNFNLDGTFEWGDEFRPLLESDENPFKQARGNKYAIRSYLKENERLRPIIKKIIFSHGAAFPKGDISKLKKTENIQFYQWQIWDSKSEDIKRYITNIIEKSADILKEKFSISDERYILKEKEIQFILESLAIKANCVLKKTPSEEIHDEIIRLQDHQVKQFDQNHERVCIDGGPGTGKSVCAEYIANKLINNHKKVLWVSFNRFFTDSIKERFSQFGLIEVKKSTQMMLDICKQNGIPSHLDDPDLMSKFAESCLELSFENELDKYDSIIIDEAQDILTKDFYDGMDFIIKNGWKDGSWYVFLDSNIQAKVHNRMEKETLKKIQNLAEFKATNKINYRNSEEVIKNASTYASIKPITCRSQLKGEVIVLSNSDNDEKFMENCIDDIIISGIRNPVLLTYKKSEDLLKSLDHDYLKNLAKRSKDRIHVVPYENSNIQQRNTVKVANIAAYKGLENNDIIVDWQKNYYDNNMKENLYYTALTRAHRNIYLILT